MTKKTVVTKEFPKTWRKGDIPYYPINDQINHALYRKYEKLAHQQKKYLFGGRLANYRYMIWMIRLQSRFKLVKYEFQAELTSFMEEVALFFFVPILGQNCNFFTSYNTELSYLLKIGLGKTYKNSFL